MPDPVPPPPSSSTPRLFLVDGYALIYRAFFALISRPLRTSRGENTSAAWGVVNFINRLITTHRPDYLGWVHDSGMSFRHEQYPAYKATREKLTEELQDDFDRGMERICQLLEAFRIPIITMRGYEADDVIGSLAKKGTAAGLNVVVVSGDKDFHQLVRKGVWLLNPGRGGPAAVDEQWVSVENGADRLGVPPERTTDYLALVGDSSDNVPGVKGIGDKGAQELIAQFGDIETILANVDQITKKRPREALIEHADDARLSKQLVTILCDLDAPFDLSSMTLREPDHATLKQLYTELEFTTLVKEVMTAAPAESKPRAATAYETVDTLQAMNRLVARARKARTIAVGVEAMVDAGAPIKTDALRSRIVGIAIALAPTEAYYLPLGHRAWEPPQGELTLGIPDVVGDRSPSDAPEDRGLFTGGDVPGESILAKKRPPAKKKAAAGPEPGGIGGKMIAERGVQQPRNLPPLGSEEMRPLVELLEDASVSKTLQNAKYDVLALRRAGVHLAGVDFDTMLASYVLDPGRRSHGMDVLAAEFLDHTMTSYEDLVGKGKGQLEIDTVPVDAARDYACEDVDMTLRLRAMFEPQLESQGMMPLFRDIEVPLSNVLAEMEWSGITIDVAHFSSLKARFQSERERVEQEIYAEAGEAFNINSNPQLRVVLFEKLGLPVKKKTATGPSTDASVLQELAEEGHVIPQLLLEYREIFKLEGTYIDALPALVNPDTKRIHTTYSQAVAATGRLSSNDPNLQNIPIRRELGRDIRRGFVPRKGWKLMAADYSQIELRLLAHLSADPAFVQAFQSGGDIHVETAAIIFGVPLDVVSKDMRARAKTINFATIYGQGAHALSRQLKISNAEAREFISTYFERFAGVRDYLEGSIDFARANGYVETLFKRRRYIPELKEKNFNIRAFGERVAQNAPIQGSAADLIKVAMIRIDRALRERKLNARMLLQVHDELVFEVPVPELDEVQTLVRAEMEGAASLSVPLVVEIGVGDNWLEAK